MDKITTAQNTQFTPFPTEVQDKIDARLKESIGAGDPRKTAKSVRPDRQAGPVPVVVPEFKAPVSSAPVQVQAPSGLRGDEAMLAKPMVVVKDPSPTPMTGPSAVPIDLPSRFSYYMFKDLYVEPFRVTHLAKLAKADDVSSMQLTAEVVSSVLSTPSGEKDLGFKLCVADFQAVLYWLRANSYKKPVMRITHQCMNREHHRRIMDETLPVQERLSRDSLVTESVHDVSFLSTRYLDVKPDPEYYHVNLTINGDVYRIDLRPETIIDTIEFLDDPRFNDAEFQYLARIASYLDLDSVFFRPDGASGVHKRWTLLERIGVVEDHFTNEDALLVREFSDLVDNFGVDENVKVKCKECGFEELVKLSIDARTFSAAPY